MKCLLPTGYATYRVVRRTCPLCACYVPRLILFNNMSSFPKRCCSIHVSAAPRVVYLAQFSLMISTPAEADSPESYMAALLVNSWMISSRHKFTVTLFSPACPVVAGASAAAGNADTGAGRHQTTLLSPIPNRRPSSLARFSEGAVDSNMMRKFLCGSGSGRLPASRGSFVRTNKLRSSE